MTRAISRITQFYGSRGILSRELRAGELEALGFSRNPGKGHAVKNLAEALKAEAVRYKLSLGWEVKTEIPA